MTDAPSIARQGLGTCPVGWHVTRIDLTLFYRTDGRPLAFGCVNHYTRVVRLDKQGFRRLPGDRWAIAYLANVQDCRGRLRWPVNWLDGGLTDRNEITATVCCERGALPDRWRDYEWAPRVTAAHWIFRGADALPPPELPAALVLRAA